MIQSAVKFHGVCPKFLAIIILGMAALYTLAASEVADSVGEGEEEQQNIEDETGVMFFVKDSVVDLDAMVEHFENLYRSKSSISESEIIITKPRTVRNLQMKSWTRGTDKMLILIQAPPREKGTATLKVDKNLWNYLPKIRRTIRIPPSMMLASWMGSDFTNDDLVRESSLRDDYACELVGRPDEGDGWLLEFTAKPGVVGLWNRFELLLSKDGRIPIEARYYDRKDRLARTIVWDEIRVFSGRRIPAHMTLLPADGEGNKTEMRYFGIDFEAEVPESTFSLSRLEQKR